MAWASSNATVPQNTYSVAKIEINVFGDLPRCAVLFWAYYQGQLNVIDWRWCEQVGIKLGFSWDGRVVLSGNLPGYMGDGHYMLMWPDPSTLTTVVADQVTRVYSREDREIEQRSALPSEKRPKLTGVGYSTSPTTLVFPTPSPTPELVEPMVAP